MIEIRRILCPVDFSDHSRRALDHAVAIARWYGSVITVTHVVAPAPVTAYGPGPVVFEAAMMSTADRGQLQASLDAFVEAEAADGVTIETRTREGNTADEVLALAGELPADLITIGTHGRSGFERLLLGSVAEKVLRKAGCPVLTVPQKHPGTVPASPVVFKRILCPIDFSTSAMRALDYALSLAQEGDGDLTVLHVLPNGYENADVVADDRMTLGDFMRRREADLRRMLDDAVPEEASSYCRVETVMVNGSPWREILKEAAERRSEVIVMGVQGRGAVDLMFFGSTTQHVVRQATCPVLTIKAL
jgi:nucleotide-binding universal stress UspA family protein